MSASGVKRVHFFLTCQTRGAISTSAPEFANYRLSIASCIPTRFRFSELATLFFMCWWLPRVWIVPWESCYIAAWTRVIAMASRRLLKTRFNPYYTCNVSVSSYVFLGSVYSFDKVHGYMYVWGRLILICLQSLLIWVAAWSWCVLSLSFPYPVHLLIQLIEYHNRHSQSAIDTTKRLHQDFLSTNAHSNWSMGWVTLTQSAPWHSLPIYTIHSIAYDGKQLSPKACPDPPKVYECLALDIEQQSWYWGRIASSYR